jgi:hypothetical protein
VTADQVLTWIIWPIFAAGLFGGVVLWLNWRG